jgi:hypothetical protein
MYHKASPITKVRLRSHSTRAFECKQSLKQQGATCILYPCVQEYGFLHMSTGDLLRAEVEEGTEIVGRLCTYIYKLCVCVMYVCVYVCVCVCVCACARL